MEGGVEGAGSDRPRACTGGAHGADFGPAAPGRNRIGRDFLGASVLEAVGRLRPAPVRLVREPATHVAEAVLVGHQLDAGRRDVSSSHRMSSAVIGDASRHTTSWSAYANVCSV